MWFGLLGDVQLRVDDRLVDAGHARQRCVLAALLVDANAVVRADQLLERVWGDRPPQRARDGLYTYLSRLRRLLTDAPDVSLDRRAGGYVLAVDPAAVDLCRFRELIGQAQAADDDEKAVRRFDDALELWRGEPFAHLDTPWLDLQRQSLYRERVAAQRDRADAALRLGRHGPILPELHVQSVQHPLDERLAGQVMLALYRSGQQAEALDRYHRLRSELGDQLGVEPQPELRDLYRRILHADATLAATSPVLSPARSVPRQLPAPPARFVGRADELARVGRAVTQNSDVDNQLTVVAISGPGGIGKSWLALRWAGDNLDRFPDGQLYVNLRGFDPAAEPMPPAAALRGFLDALGVPPATMPADVDALAGRFRSMVAGRRMLIVLDNARDTAQVLPLLPGVGAGTVLVTSRASLTGLVIGHGALPVGVGLLPAAEAGRLLTGVVGQRVTAEPDSAAAILDHCGGLPLALSIAAARAVTHPELPLAVFAQQLRDATTRLDSLDTDDLTTNLRAVFAASCRVLTPDAARVFALLGVPAGPDIGAAAVASLAGLPPGRCHAVLRELTDAHLVAQQAPDRYRLHDLVRLYAAERDEPTVDRRAALGRLLDHYAYLAEAADRMRDPEEPVAPGTFANRDQAVAWFRAEHDVLVTLCGQAAATGFDRHACRLAFSLRHHLDDGGHWDELATVQHAALAAARRLADRAAEAHASDCLARAYARTRRLDEAEPHYRQAVDIFRALGDAAGEARAQRGLGGLCARRGQHTAAAAHNQRALDLYRAVGDHTGQAMALNNAAWLSVQRDDFPDALARCEEALALLASGSGRGAAAATWDTLGSVHQRRGDYQQAAACYQRSVEISRELGERFNEADTLCRLAEARRVTGDHAAARAAWQRALANFEEIGHPAAGDVRTTLMGLDGGG
ncbi:BTAD domain-containing putative transcriptional regulator [Actinomycetes bacterium KLBMP 9797]